MIGVVDYGMGNVRSVLHALEAVGADARICPDPAALDPCERLVLPGVGAFRDGVANLRARGFAEALDRAVLRERRPIFGICLGLQLMARLGHENGRHPGLGWLDAEVVRLEPADPALKVPHVGWNRVAPRPGSPLFEGLPADPDLYFTHSYQLRCASPDLVDATCEYGGTITAAVRRDNLFGTQFHPEKSQEPGLRLLARFLRWTP
jgi:glutamine amidotransferase